MQNKAVFYLVDAIFTTEYLVCEQLINGIGCNFILICMEDHYTATALAGGTAGVSARLLSNPLDVLKIRFQLQEEAISKKCLQSKYTGVLQSFRTILHEEGLGAFWKGTVPGTWLYFVYGSVQFTCFDIVNRTLTGKVKNSSVCSFVSGCAGGAGATLVSYPLDILRTRLIGQGSHSNKYYKNLSSGIVMMYREAGIRAFYKGIVPTLIVIAPQSGINFGVYYFLRHLWQIITDYNRETDAILQGKKGIDSLVFGGVAGLTSKTIVLPLDIVKKRLQVQGFEEARRPFGKVSIVNGTIHAFSTIYSKEGILGFYKGAVPGLLKTSFATAIVFYVYEYMLNITKSQ